MDVSGAVRTPSYPDGVYVNDVTHCAEICLADPYCNVAVFNMGGGDRCFPLREYSGVHAAGSRALLAPSNNLQPGETLPSLGGGTGGRGVGGGGGGGGDQQLHLL